MHKNTELKELAKLFFKPGSISFGGAAAHIAMMEDEVRIVMGSLYESE